MPAGGIESLFKKIRERLVATSGTGAGPLTKSKVYQLDSWYKTWGSTSVLDDMMCLLDIKYDIKGGLASDAVNEGELAVTQVFRNIESDDACKGSGKCRIGHATHGYRQRFPRRARGYATRAALPVCNP